MRPADVVAMVDDDHAETVARALVARGAGRLGPAIILKLQVVVSSRALGRWDEAHRMRDQSRLGLMRLFATPGATLRRTSCVAMLRASTWWLRFTRARGVMLARDDVLCEGHAHVAVTTLVSHAYVWGRVGDADRRAAVRLTEAWCYAPGAWRRPWLLRLVAVICALCACIPLHGPKGADEQSTGRPRPRRRTWSGPCSCSCSARGTCRTRSACTWPPGCRRARTCTARPAAGCATGTTWPDWSWPSPRPTRGWTCTAEAPAFLPPARRAVAP